MRINQITSLNENIQAGDIISVEFDSSLAVEGIVVEQDNELVIEFDEQGNNYLTELLPLIPLAVSGAGAALTAYDAYNAKKAYDRGDISAEELATQVGTDVATSLVGGGAVKLAGRAAKAATTAVKKAFKKTDDVSTPPATTKQQPSASSQAVKTTSVSTPVRTTTQPTAATATPAAQSSNVARLRKLAGVNESTERLDEALPVLGALAVAGGAWTAVDLYNIAKDALEDGKITKDEYAEFGKELAINAGMVVGGGQAIRMAGKAAGAAGRGISDAWKTLVGKSDEIGDITPAVQNTTLGKQAWDDIKADAVDMVKGGVPAIGAVAAYDNAPVSTQTKIDDIAADAAQVGKDAAIDLATGIRNTIRGNADNDVNEAEYQGRKVELNKPIRTGRDEPKKFKVYVKDDDKVKMVRFGHQGTGNEKTMSIKKSDPKRRKSFRARHNCSNPGPKTKARYWSCKAW